MNRTVYVNGQYLPETQAKISIFDRGFLFADAVYEVSAVLGGHLIDNEAHLARLQRSLTEMGITSPIGREEIIDVQRTLIDRNDLDEGTVYLQMSRGSADRDFAYPEGARPTLVMFTQARDITNNPASKNGISVITFPDLRWKRRDIKSVGLLAAAMAKQAAVEAGADDAWLVENEFITEGSSHNAYIITADSTIVTRHLTTEILHGITRVAVLKLCAEAGLELEERPFSVAQAHAAREAFLTSASNFVIPVVSIDGKAVADGKPGAITKRLRELYIEQALAEVQTQI